MVAISRPSLWLYDIQLWMHSWGFSFQLNASRNKILENGFTLADSDLKAFPKRFYRENITGLKPQALEWVLGCDINLTFIFPISSNVKNPSKGIVFSKMGPAHWNVLALMQRNFKVQCKLAFCCTDQMKAANPLFIFWLKRFSFNGNFDSSSTKSGMRMSELSGVLWNFAYAKYAFYFLPVVPSEAAKWISNKFLKLQHQSLALLLKVWTMNQQHQ